VYITTKKGDWAGGQKIYYTEGSYTVPARPFGKNRPIRKSIGSGNLEVMESEILEHPTGKYYLSIWSKFRILFRGLDYEKIFRILSGWVWTKILNLSLERMP
jgi:hypothetical protein